MQDNLNIKVLIREKPFKFDKLLQSNLMRKSKRINIKNNIKSNGIRIQKI